MSQRSAKDAALDYFAQRYNCAESVLLGLIEYYNLECECAPRIASGFGGGVGQCGDLCGAVSGAVMAIGLIFGRDDLSNPDQKTICYNKVEQLIELFEAEFGTLECSTLTDCEMRSPEGRARAKELDLHNTLCPKYVAYAAQAASSIIGG